MSKQIKGGYAGKTLWVDLSKNKILIKDLDPELAVNYIGGRGFVAKLLFDLVDPEKDPLDPQNPLVFTTGPLSGIAPASGRFTVGARSPATGIHGDSNSGGDFAMELKHAGYDFIVVTGRAEEPVYISIQDENVEIKSAKDLWGLTTHKTFDRLREEEGDRNIKAVTIGPAGENLVATAAIVETESRTAARAGMGAVMGSKNLKAISVRGTKDIKIANYEAWKEAFEELLQVFLEDPMTSQVGRLLGSNFLHRVHSSHGALIVENGHRGYATEEELEKVSAESILKYHVKGRSCYLCPIACTRSIYMESKKYGIIKGRGPEYYSMQSLTYRAGGWDTEAGIYLNKLCDAYGIDATTLPSNIAFAIDLYENGIITKEQVGGLELTWGNFDAMEEIIKSVAYRKGKIGELFAKSTKELIKEFGPESEWYALEVKGLTMPSNDPRAGNVYNMRYAIATRGADHLRVSVLSSGRSLKWDELSEYEAMKVFVHFETYVTLVNLFNVCNWAYSSYTSTPEMAEIKEKGMFRIYNAATGLNLTPEDFAKAAHRTIVTERAENVRYGLRREHDYLPRRVFEEPLPVNEKGDTKIFPREKFEKLLDAYYALRGLDPKTTVPKPSVLRELGLSKIEEDLKRRGLIKEGEQ